MIVYAIVGSCGAGKTTLLESMPKKIKVHKEGYVEHDSVVGFIDNRTYLSKLRYLNGWFQEMIQRKKRRTKRILSDRCPFDACAYVSNERMQHDMVQAYMTDLQSVFDISVKTIYLRVPFSMIKKRVQERLVREPWRKKYHEGDERFLRKTWSYYEKYKSEWDYIIPNEGNLEASTERLMEITLSR
jgi:thymidylate kinase